MSPAVSKRSSGIAAIDGGSERSERVSPASVNGLHPAASADTTASPEGQGGARSFRRLTRAASRCTSSSGPCQGEGRRFEPGVPLQIARIPRTWWIRAFSWPSPFMATPQVRNGSAEERLFEENPPIGRSIWRHHRVVWNKDGTFAAPPYRMRDG